MNGGTIWEKRFMLRRTLRATAASVCLSALLAVPVLAQEPRPGGVLHMYQRDSPASASVQEEATYSTNVPFMSIFNNLVIYKQDVPQNSDASIEPELATAWSWNDDKTQLTFKLREGVKWHDGKPFTARDVKCTFDLIQDKGEQHFRKNPRKLWYQNLKDVVVKGDHEVTLQLGRPQPSILAMLAFMAGKLDMTFPMEVTPPLMRDIKSNVPKAICYFGPQNVNENLIINREKAPFDNPDIRRAMALTLDRKAFIDILFEGQADIGGTLLPQPDGVWGMPKDQMEQMLGYNPDIQKNRAEARKIMEKLGYGPDHRLKVVVSTRNIPSYRDPAVILIDHLKEIYIDG
ncbi:MAG: hypothetical protein J0H99_09575, partial [Rhodospirillales bacterium]|nr:hypothetical protein [Rhodospirillales bacterium]